MIFFQTDTSCCNRCFCGNTRPFDMRITDNSDREVIHLYRYDCSSNIILYSPLNFILNFGLIRNVTFFRPLRCDSCWFPCCLQTLEVTSSGTRLGSVDQMWSICKPYYKIRDANGNTVLKIVGPFCTFSMCGDVTFDVLSKDESTQVGKISKKWSGLARELFTDADHFGISFPGDLDVNIKAVLMGACFLIVSFFSLSIPTLCLLVLIFEICVLMFINSTVSSFKIRSTSYILQDFMFFDNSGGCQIGLGHEIIDFIRIFI